ncbi:hypothetical protein JZ751_021323 [Albula glossodonta]|uniref:Uncharacterized protein n=1 Tax=Albula glossodonta TaxID=121402 RepID=A0A8T2NIL0_9TELE|nr:hypothetical protein JZ751_021323 [Albula glossodonta]
MNSPTRYFQASLKLRGRFDIDRALMDAGIKPSCNSTYKFDDLHSALAPMMGDHPEIQCLKDSQDREVVIQVKIPLFKNFTLGCHHRQGRGEPMESQTVWSQPPGHPCPRNIPLYYFPISHEHPDQPCD